MKKILFISDTTGFGGAELYMLNLASYMHKNGYFVTLVVPKTDSTKFIRDKCNGLEINFKFVETRIISKQTFITSIINSFKILVSENPDKVFIPLQNPLGSFSTLIICRILRIDTVVSFLLVTDSLFIKKKKKSIYKWVFKKIKIIAVSNNNAELVSDKFKIELEKINVVQNTSNLKKESFNVDRFKEEFLERYRIKKNVKLIIMPARISTQKDHEAVLRAIPLIIDVYPHIVFLFAGDYTQEKLHFDHLTALMNDLKVNPFVIFLGYQAEIYYKLLKISDIFLLATNFEGQPTAVLDAMKLEMPIIATAVSGIPELIEHNYNGLLVEKNNSEDLAKSIILLLTNKKKAELLGLMNLEITKKYNFETMCEKILALI